jgi:hypothetical protein
MPSQSGAIKLAISGSGDIRIPALEADSATIATSAQRRRDRGANASTPGAVDSHISGSGDVKAVEARGAQREGRHLWCRRREGSGHCATGLQVRIRRLGDVRILRRSVRGRSASPVSGSFVNATSEQIPPECLAGSASATDTLEVTLDTALWLEARRRGFFMRGWREAESERLRVLCGRFIGRKQFSGTHDSKSPTRMQWRSPPSRILVLEPDFEWYEGWSEVMRLSEPIRSRARATWTKTASSPHQRSQGAKRGWGVPVILSYEDWRFGQ